MTEALEGQMSIYDLGTWSGRMSPEPCPAETRKGKISASSLKKRQGSQSRMPLYLDLRGLGANRVASWVEGGALAGEYTMRSFGESPREENVSRLSQILQDNPLPKYSLSARACQGILARAARRGKELPDVLRTALENQCNDSSDLKN